MLRPTQTVVHHVLRRTLLVAPPRRLSYLLHPSTGVMAAFRVTPIPLFRDNYCWLVENQVHHQCLVVDPADPEPVLIALQKKAECVGVLTTHCHSDHAGGNEELARRLPGIAVVGGSEEDGRIPAATLLVKDEQPFELAGLSIRALHTPCHTRGHTCYIISGGPDSPDAIFTGDTLFSAGCGRFFEGTAPQMAQSLASIVAHTKPDTLVYCGHEYTAANLRFGLHVEPGNAAMMARLQEVESLRSRGLPSVPSTMAVELATNVFLRCAAPAVRAFTGCTDPVEALAALREAKNAFA